MYLEKWYGDYVADGTAHVHYRARLRTGLLTLGYSGTIASDGERAGGFRFGSIALPSVRGDRVAWPLERGGEILWQGAHARPFRLLDGPEGRIVWNPWVLNGRTTGTGTDPVSGYLECLTMRGAPWRVGLRVLRWGRFCGARESLVWVEWQGARALHLLLFRGQPIGLRHIRPDGIASLDGLELSWCDPPQRFLAEPLYRSAPVAGALLRAFAFFRGMQERWMCRARLSVGARLLDTGTAIFEELRWP